MPLVWSSNCIISEISRTAAVNGDNPVEATLTTGATFQINNAKFYVPVVTLSINNNIKFLENIKHGFKRRVSWNKYGPEITTQPKKKKQFRCCSFIQKWWRWSYKKLFW